MYLFVFFFSVIILTVIDQLTKFITLNSLKPIGSITFIDKIIDFTYVENRGAAFGILQNSRWIFISVTIVVAAILVWYVIAKKPQNRLLYTSLILILSGAIGNSIDRLLRGFVVDMIEITFISYPVFNFADCCVVVGALLFCVYVMFFYKEQKKE